MDEKEILVFRVANREMGIPIKYLQGIENYVNITMISDAPNYIEGIINIRDEVFPVLDLKMKLSLPAQDVSVDTKLIIIQSNASKIACVIDEVVGIHTVGGDDLQEFPMIIRSTKTNYADSVARINGRLVVVMNPKRLFDEDEKKEVLAVQDAK